VKPLRVAPVPPQIQQPAEIIRILTTVESSTVLAISTTLHEDSDEESNIDDIEANLPLGEEAEGGAINAQSGSEDESEKN